jgi:hypothetical protein
MTTAMAPPAQRSTRAAWAKNAEYIDPQDATPDMITLGNLCDRTGLTPQAVRSAIARPGDHSNRRAPLRMIARPRWNVGGEPRWDQSQIASYFAVIADLRSADRTWAHLPRLTVEQAVTAQLISLSGMGRKPPEGPGIPKTTNDRWRKWGTEEDDTEVKRIHPYPLPIARIDRGSGSPMLLYPWRSCQKLEEVLVEGLLARHGEVDERWLAEALRQKPVREWLLINNPRWVESSRTRPGVDLDVWITRP